MLTDLDTIILNIENILAEGNWEYYTLFTRNKSLVLISVKKLNRPLSMVVYCHVPSIGNARSPTTRKLLKRLDLSACA